jgi:hypothetical protein
MAQSILELIFKTSKSGTGGKAAAAELKEFKGTVGEISGGLLGFNAAGLTAAGAIVAVGNYAKQSVEKFLAYGAAVREMASITGTGTEATSRLIQTMDDLGVTQEQLASITQQASKKGFVMTTENLAKLADQYNELNTIEEKNKLLTDTLGKSGLELAKVMQEGGTAIREMAAAQSESMILTEAEAAAAEQLRRNIDEATDTYEGYSLMVGGTMAEAYNKAAEASRAHAKAVEEHRMKTNDDYRAQMEMNQAGRDLIALIGPATEGIAGYNGELENTPGALNAVEDAQIGVNDVMKTYNDTLLFTIASEGLSADAALDLATKMGLVDANTQMAYDKTALWKKQLDDGKITVEEYNRLVKNLSDTIANIKDRDIEINVHVNTEYSGGVNTGLEAGALPSGYTDYNANGADFVVPPGYPNDSYRMGVSSGERVTVVNDRMRWTGEGGGEQVVFHIGQVTIANEADYQKLFRRLSQDITREMRRS